MNNEKREKLKAIPINVWDDYYDDGFVPEGEKQETYAYVEDVDALSLNEKRKIMNMLYDVILKLGMNDPVLKGIGVTLSWVKSMDRKEVRLENITHEQRHHLVKVLQGAGLKYKELPFHVYSES